MIFLKLFIATIISIVFALPGFATQKLSFREGRKLAEKAKKNSDFPIVMNDRVLKELNKFLSNPGGRKHLRTCLERMKKYRPVITTRLDKQKLPQELMAIPVIESGYQNIHSPNGWGSGLWMFIKSTARSFGLKVNEKIDQRLNVKLSTDAALKYLKRNHRMFKDWQLAVLAYNMGEYRLKAAIKKTGTRDPWKLIQKGHHNDQHYLAKIMAVIIIMKNPKVL